jgi:Arc/MetJ-type ribon-helix-helix transcriptional regulator
MAAKTISLPREPEAYMDAKAASGENAHPSEAVRDALITSDAPGSREAHRDIHGSIVPLLVAVEEGRSAVITGPDLTPEERRQAFRRYRSQTVMAFVLGAVTLAVAIVPFQQPERHVYDGDLHVVGLVTAVFALASAGLSWSRARRYREPRHPD